MNPASSHAFDVAVIGGGPSGCAAAIAAARDGARTLLVESGYMLGGAGTLGLVPCWGPFSDRRRIISGGLAERIGRRAVEAAPYRTGGLDWQPVNHEELKRIYDELVTEAGVTVWFGSTLVGAECSGKRVQHVTVARKKQLCAVSAGVFIDCTGDGDLAAAAGAEILCGGDEYGEVQPATLCFVLANVDTGEFLRHPRPSLKELREVADRSRYPLLGDLHLVTFLVGPGLVGFNAGHLWADHTRPENLDRAVIEGRRIAAEYCRAMREYFPAFREAFLCQTAGILGVRESRRIVGDYLLTIDDYLACRSFPDDIARNAYPIDIHTRQSEIDSVLNGANVAMNRRRHYAPGESHGIPYRCLTVKGFDNLLAAGRCISTDHEVQASIRIMPVCLTTGEAAGCAAAIAVQRHCGDAHAVNAAFLRSRLKSYGACVDPLPLDGDFAFGGQGVSSLDPDRQGIDAGY